MRMWLVALVAGGALAQAGGAFAQVNNYSYMSPPPAQAIGTTVAVPNEPPQAIIPSPYDRKLAFLKNKMQFLKAKDGGHLKPEHAALIQRELEALNTRTDLRRN